VHASRQGRCATMQSAKNAVPDGGGAAAACTASHAVLRPRVCMTSRQQTLSRLTAPHPHPAPPPLSSASAAPQLPSVSPSAEDKMLAITSGVSAPAIAMTMAATANHRSLPAIMPIDWCQQPKMSSACSFFAVTDFHRGISGVVSGALAVLLLIRLCSRTVSISSPARSVVIAQLLVAWPREALGFVSHSESWRL
jgi:hypothetical protein